MGENVIFVTGKEWRRHQPTAALLEPMEPPVSVVIVSYTHKDPCFTSQECLREIKWTHKCHMFGSKLADIRYSFLIGGDAAVYECRGWTSRPSLPSKFKCTFDDFIFISFMGRFADMPPGKEMMEALRWLLKNGVENNYLTTDYKEICLESQMPATETGHAVSSTEDFVKEVWTQNCEANGNGNTANSTNINTQKFDIRKNGPRSRERFTDFRQKY